MIAARENETPFLGREGFQRLVEAALGYFRDEHDTRGFDRAKGWMHSVAHTSDLLKFLARNPLLAAADQTRMLAAMTAKARETSPAFSQGEDERMARIAISIIRRSDFDREAFTAWLALEQTAAAFPAHVTSEALRSQQNVRHLMMALWTELSADDRPSEGADLARLSLHDTLKKLF